jgi:WD40 repeat protein/serine/threonine protein kinase
MVMPKLNEEAIFHVARQIKAPEVRRLYLRQSCGDDADLQARVEALLRVYDQERSFLQPPAEESHATVDEPPVHERSGTIIGPYKLLQPIGEGGMGTVYLAQQMGPVKRQVALKVIKPGMDSRQVIARFEAERQALALMDHPNIAKVHDAGTTPDGRPFFVMELVKGVPVTTYCDEHKLTPRRRLELFVPVCQAIQHAHQKGIIHRDIKPRNVLVSLSDDKPVPKVIDFGVAKATGTPLTERTLHTGFGTVVGTLEYMSPEQASLNQLDIDTRSDVYSLGVLLYELLAGSPPFSRKELGQAGVLDMLRMIREQEPSKPSAKLSAAEGLPTLAANRGTEPKRLTRLVRGELDWIVMKALEKDRNRRYETANGLAMDVQRHLADEPVQAGPPSVRYRLWKFARKNRRLVITAIVAGVLFLAVAVSVAVAAVQFRALAAQEAAARETTDVGLYYRTIALAEREWSTNSLIQMDALLDSCRPDLRGWEWRCLKRLRYERPVTFRGHGRGEVKGVAVRPDGRIVASASGAEVQVWEAATGRVLRTLSGHSQTISRIAFSPGGDRLATAGSDHLVKLWDPETGRELHTLQGHTEPVRAIAFSPDGRRLASASGAAGEDGQVGEVRLWDVATGGGLRTWHGHGQAIDAVAFHPDGNRLATASWDQSVDVWDVDSGGQLSHLPGQTSSPFHCVAFSADGRRLAAGTGGGRFYVWDANTGARQLYIRGFNSLIAAITFSPDGERLVAGGWDKTVKVFHATTGEEVLGLRGHGDTVTGLSFSADGQKLASASEDGTVIVWDGTPLTKPPGLEPVGTLKGHEHVVQSVAFSPDGRRLASASFDGTIKLWDPAGGGEVRTLTGHAGFVWCVAFSPNGRRIASAGNDDRTARIWDAETGKEILKLPGHQDEVKGVVFSPDGRLLASCGDGVWIWDTTTGQVVHSLRGHTARVHRVAFNQDGTRLASCSSDRTVKIWDVATGTALHTLEGHKLAVYCVTFSPDGKTLASAGKDRTVRIWDVATGRELRQLDGHSDTVWGVAFSPDGNRLATASADHTVKIWDAPTGAERMTCWGHTREVYGLAWSPDGVHVASSGNDSMILLWEVPLDAGAR